MKIDELQYIDRLQSQSNELSETIGGYWDPKWNHYSDLKAIPFSGIPSQGLHPTITKNRLPIEALHKIADGTTTWNTSVLPQVTGH